MSPKNYTAMELPAHLYMVALETGRITVDHWSYLMSHATMVVQLAASRGDREMQDIADWVVGTLNLMVVQYSSTGMWYVQAGDLAMLKKCLTQMGGYYRDKPKKEVTTAKQKGAEALASVMKQFSAMWAT